MSKPTTTVTVTITGPDLADELMTRAMKCELAGKQALATAHLELARKVLIHHFKTRKAF